MVVTKNNTMNLLSKKWQEVYLSMSVHTQNRLPTDIFVARRPLESLNENALAYRLANYRNISKSAFDLAIDQIIEVANTIDVTVEYGEQLTAYLEKYRLFDGYKVVTLREWIINFVGRYKETDPNSLVVVLPKHPSQLLNPSFESELPDFNAVINRNIETENWLVPYSDIIYIDDYEFEFKAGHWTLDDTGRTEVYYFRMTKDQIILKYPTKTKDKIEYVEYSYYNLRPYDLHSYPAYVTGNNAITWSDDKGEILTYYVSNFYGAGQVADLQIGQMSDLQIIENRFCYPTKWERQRQCKSGCMQDLSTGIFMLNDKPCNTCSGTGFISDTTPLGTYVMTDDDVNDNGDIKAPVGFISPNTEILKHSADRFDAYNNLVYRELGLTSQNFTNQSGESKRLDMAQKVSLHTSVVTDLYRLLLNIYSMNAKYIGDPKPVTVTLPENMDVKNVDDLKDELADAKSSDLPYPAVVELTKRYMLAKFGKNETNRKKVDYLALYDKLFVYGIKDMTQAVAVLGSDITNRDKMLHLMAWQMLDQIEGLIDMDFERINEVINAMITPLIPVQAQPINLGEFANETL